MAAARFFDGKLITPHDVTVEKRGDDLVFQVGETAHAWPLAKIEAITEQQEVRLAWRGAQDARLIMAQSDWEGLAGAQHNRSSERRRKTEYRIAGGLAVFAVATLLFVFVGVPALSGPLARMTPPDVEERFGDNMERQMREVMPRCQGGGGQAILARLGDEIAAGADTPFDVRVQAVQAPMINAMALPGGRVWVTDDLIREAKNPDEVAAVVAHEVAHIEKRHVMRSVFRSLGIGMILDAVVGGGTGAGQQAVILAGNATELSYGRKDETEADSRGQQLLHRQGMSSHGMATFFERLEDGSTGNEKADLAAEFASSHPNSARRAEAARSNQRDGRAALSPEDWATLRQACDTVDYERLEEIRRRIDPRVPSPNRND